VQGLKSAKEIWDILKTTHEGDEVTTITKRETIEGELGQSVLNKGEEPQAMYNQLKTMVNQVHSLGSTKWDDHEIVAEPPELFQLKCLSHASGAATHLNRNNPSVPQI
jgi:hypothetical protein